MLWRSNANITRESRAKRKRRLLAEFLQERSARQPANAEEETSPQDLEIEVQNQQSETVLICKRLTSLKPSHYGALPHVRPPGFEDKSRSYLHFLNLDDGENNFMESSVVELSVIQASYDGLILATSKKGNSLILMNPVTRKHIGLPLGTHEGNFYDESFGIALCNQAKTYKVVHLFLEESGCIGCEVLHICTRKWTRIEGPPSELLVDLRRIPVSIGGSLYWMSSKQGCDYFVSMNVHDEKFISNKLPVSIGLRDRLLEIGGDLAFVTHAQHDLLHVWILMNDGRSRENWTRRYHINLSVRSAFPIPICCLRNGKGMVLLTMLGLYVCNFETGEMKPIHSRSDDSVWYRRLEKRYIPHRNTLKSWEDHLKSPS